MASVCSAFRMHVMAGMISWILALALGTLVRASYDHLASGRRS